MSRVAKMINQVITRALEQRTKRQPPTLWCCLTVSGPSSKEWFGLFLTVSTTKTTLDYVRDGKEAQLQNARRGTFKSGWAVVFFFKLKRKLSIQENHRAKDTG